MLCTVIIPTWNRAKYLSKAIDSCLAQTYFPVEILIMDDGSTDGTRQLVEKKYIKKNLPRGITIAYHALPHRGVCAARNAGLAKAHGEVIAYLDSDNIWFPNCLADLLAPFQHGASCAYGMLRFFLPIALVTGVMSCSGHSNEKICSIKISLT